MKNRIHSYPRWAVAVAAVILLVPLSAKTANLTTYQATAGQAQFDSVGELDFAFSGLNLSINGFEEFPAGPCGGRLGSPCGKAGDSINVNTLLMGTFFGSGMAGGTNYPTLQFAGEIDFLGAALVIPNAINPVLKEAINFNNNPFATACVPPFLCFVGGGPDAVFNFVLVPTGEVTISLRGPDQFGIYTLGGAVYSPTPEPGSIALFGSSVLGLAAVLHRKLVL